ncbi:MAG: hypothetical protein WC683_08225 [bacterium]
MIAQARPHNNNFVVPALGLAILLAFVVATPWLGAVDAVPSAHVSKHEAGTLPASVINAEIVRGNCRWYYSARYQQHLALVEVSGMCGGAIFRRNAAGALIEVTCFGGSECTQGDCTYWRGVIASGGYVPVASMGG